MVPWRLRFLWLACFPPATPMLGWPLPSPVKSQTAPPPRGLLCPSCVRRDTPFCSVHLLHSTYCNLLFKFYFSIKIYSQYSFVRVSGVQHSAQTLSYSTQWSPWYFQYPLGTTHSHYSVIDCIPCAVRHIPYNFHCFCWRFYLFIFRERGREGEREGEKHQRVVASQAPSTQDLAYTPGMCPDWESNWWAFGLQAGTQSTEPPHPGLVVCLGLFGFWLFTLLE